MTEEIDEQISAFMDDELSAEESAFLVRRLESDAAARSQFIRYATIGSALRGDLLLADSTVLRRRIQESIAGRVPDPARLSSASTRRARFGRSVAGFGVAALVAVLALIGLRNINGSALGDPGGSRVADEPSVELSAPVSYVVPPELPQARVIEAPIRLTNYLVQHGSFASTLSRTSINSNVIGVVEPELESQAQEGEADR